MKLLTLLLLCQLAAVNSTQALGINIAGLGESLHGWSKARTAVYSMDNQRYRTHIPTVTRNLDGGIFVSMRVEHLSGERTDATGFIELTFTPSRQVGAAQVRLNMNGHRHNTGLVLRPEEELSDDAIGSADWRSNHMKLVLDLFNQLDTEFAKAKAKEDGDREGTLGSPNGFKSR